MAFSASAMALLGDGGFKKLYHYNSGTDAMSVILGASYFNSFWQQLSVGDLVICQDSGDLVALARITASSSAAVTVSYATGWIQQAKINDPTGGATVDAEARTAIVAIIDALEAHGITAAV